ncbi:MAG: PBPRA1643 family SWIM/SEC-C metal-binding motif protein [Thermodesulfobacteriota bacterium]
MAKLGSSKRPAVVRVRTEARAHEILALCNERGWQVIVGLEADQPEDISDLERLLNPTGSAPPRTIFNVTPPIGRNAPCLCGSGLKYKKCCGQGSK